ncbi:MAG: flagella basal body P-ring formation protein FlgA [Terriglobales bacterium]|jgi:hypothetical protein
MLLGRVKRVASLVAVCTCAVSYGNAQVRSERVPISQEVVADAVRVAGTDVTPDQVHLLSNVTARAGATLRVAKVSAAPDGKLLAELKCKSRDCLPFYVLLNGTNDGQREASKGRPNAALAKLKEHPLVARGQPVTLIIENADSRIKMSVICLEGGMPGQTIRVASLDRRRIYTAEVVNSAVVRSAL